MSLFTPASIPVIGLDSQPARDDDAKYNKPIICVGGDHPYLQWWGSNGSNGLAAMYLDKGIRPYLAICTDDPNGEVPGGANRLSWEQVLALQNRGVEITNHGARHVASWERATTGFTVRYTGAGTDAFMTINSSKLLTTTCTGAAGDNQSFDLTSASYNTLAKVVAAFNAVSGGVYTARLAPELTGNELSVNVSGITGLGIKGSVADAYGHVSAWTASTTYVVGDVRKAVTDNGYYFVCTTGGSNGAVAEPTWVKQVGATTADGGGVVWTCRYPQAQLSSGTVAPLKGTNVCASGGIILNFNDTTKKSAYVTISGLLMTLYVDGVQVATLSLTNAAQDTLTKLVAVINAITVTGASPSTPFTAKLVDNTYYDSSSNFGSAGEGLGNNNYCGGGELSRDLQSVTVVDITNKWVRIDTGIPQWNVHERLIEQAHTTALANGVTLAAFCQSGSEFFPWHAKGHARYSSWRGNPYVRQSVQPLTMLASDLPAFNGWFPHRDVSSTPALTSAQLTAYVDAMIDSGAYLSYMLCHDIRPDGTTAYNLYSDPGSNTPFPTESTWNTFLAYLKTKVDAGSIDIRTPSQIPDALVSRSPPPNMVFNSLFKNSGNSVAGVTANVVDVGGWNVTRVGTITTMSIDSLGYATLTANGSSQIPFTQDLSLMPGEVYELGLYVEYQDTTAASNGVRLALQTRRGRWRDIKPASSNTITSPYVLQSGLLTWRFTCPARQNFFKAYTRSLIQEPYDLSVNNKIKVNYDALGNVAADINIAGGTPGATRAKEVAAAINTAVAADVTYIGRAEYHNAARAENGYVIIELPYTPSSNGFTARVVSGSANDALATVWGPVSGGICAGEPLNADYFATQEIPVFFYIEVNTTNGASVKIGRPFCRRIRTV